MRREMTAETAAEHIKALLACPDATAHSVLSDFQASKPYLLVQDLLSGFDPDLIDYCLREAKQHGGMYTFGELSASGISDDELDMLVGQEWDEMLYFLEEDLGTMIDEGV